MQLLVGQELPARTNPAVHGATAGLATMRWAVHHLLVRHRHHLSLPLRHAVPADWRADLDVGEAPPM